MRSNWNSTESTNTAQLALKNNGQNWPVPPDERTLTPAEQNKLEIHFGVVTPEPRQATPAKRKRR